MFDILTRIHFQLSEIKTLITLPLLDHLSERKEKNHPQVHLDIRNLIASLKSHAQMADFGISAVPGLTLEFCGAVIQVSGVP